VRRYGAGGSVALYVDGPVKPLRIIATLATSDSPSIRIAFVWKINVSPCIPHAKPLPRTIAEVVVLKAPEIPSLVPGPREGVDEDSTVALSPRGATDPLPGTFPEHAAALAKMTAILMQYRHREDPAMGFTGAEGTAKVPPCRDRHGVAFGGATLGNDERANRRT